MARKKINWRKVDNERLINLVRRVNAKITRVSKISEEMAQAQPERLNITELRQELSTSTREQYNIFINRYNRYMRQGAENVYITKVGGVATNWAKKEVQYAIARENRYRAKQREFMVKMGVEPSKYRGSLGLEDDFADRPNVFEEYSRTRIQNYIKAVFRGEASFENGKRTQQFRENIYTALRKNLKELAEDIINELNDFNDDYMLVAYMEEDILRSGVIHSERDAKIKYNEIMEYIERLREKYKIERLNKEPESE